MINIDHFIKQHITFRPESFFREDIEANKDLLRERIEGKSVLVIGGAGTIGSSYIKSVLQFEPARLFVVDISENGLTELTRDLRSSWKLKVPEVYKTYPINFHDEVFERIFRNEGPFEIVANFAAHKHVRSEKDEYSITAMIENNVIRAEKLLKLLKENPPEHFFCVSTDKAANPVNIMGASKKIMEEVIMAYSNSFPITTARFANVAFSNGSLLDGYIQRMMKQQPLSCPSDVRRFFVSPKESGEICMLSCMLGKPGEIFFPRLREDQMMNFYDITLHFIKEMGYEPLICESEEQARMAAADMKPDAKKYPVFFFKTDTSGEKLYEEFSTDEEEVDNNRFSSLGVITNAPRKTVEEVREMSNRLEETLKSKSVSKEEIVKIMESFLPGFRHIETGKNLDQKM